ncbi:MAG: hypothetical protein GY938_27260, partial [Ketobacter sp.]|nr:hypothetical protein [Ketobacter sp.]
TDSHRTSQSSQSPPLHHNHATHLKFSKSNPANRLNRTSALPPPGIGNSLYAYTFDTKSTSRSPKRRSSFSSVSTASASVDHLPLSNHHSHHSQHSHHSNTSDTSLSDTQQFPFKLSDKFAIQRKNLTRNHALSTKSVGGTAKFTFAQSHKSQTGHKQQMKPLLDTHSISEYSKVRSKSNPNILGIPPLRKIAYSNIYYAI